MQTSNLSAAHLFLYALALTLSSILLALGASIDQAATIPFLAWLLANGMNTPSN